MSNLPPKVPNSAPEIARAIELLNLRIQADLERAERAELKELLGVYPSHAQAAVWRQGLKRILDNTDGGARVTDGQPGEANNGVDGPSANRIEQVPDRGDEEG